MYKKAESKAIRISRWLCQWLRVLEITAFWDAAYNDGNSVRILEYFAKAVCHRSLWRILGKFMLVEYFILLTTFGQKQYTSGL